MASRIGANPVLHTLLETLPEIFVYGEALIYKHSNIPKIPGYSVILHTALKNTVRGGIAVYFKEELSGALSLDSASKTYDIIWIRLKTSKKENIPRLFNSPVTNHEN